MITIITTIAIVIAIIIIIIIERERKRDAYISSLHPFLLFFSCLQYLPCIFSFHINPRGR